MCPQAGPPQRPREPRSRGGPLAWLLGGPGCFRQVLLRFLECAGRNRLPAALTGQP
jgi:hypothetical protein